MYSVKNLNRRQVIRTAIGSAAFPILHALSPHCMAAPRRATPTAVNGVHSQTLALVFHGLFAFLFGQPKDWIEIVVPAVTGHNYWAGNFGQEDQNPLQTGTRYSLFGVGQGSWSPTFDFPYVSKLSVQDESQVRCRILVPWPDDLFCDRQIPAKAGQPFFTSGMNPQPKQFPTIYTFVYYDKTIASRPSLTGTSWDGPRTMGQPNGTGHANLHIRAEHCQGMGADGWRVLNGVFGLTGSDALTLNGIYTYATVGAPAGIGNIVPPGEEDFLHEESQCQPGPGTVVGVATAVNCASVGGGKK